MRAKTVDEDRQQPRPSHVEFGVVQPRQPTDEQDDVAGFGVGADVTDPADLQSLVTVAVERFGRLDVLVGNAGISRISSVADMDVDGWSAMVDVNVKGILHGIAAALPVLRRQGSGHSSRSCQPQA